MIAAVTLAEAAIGDLRSTVKCTTPSRTTLLRERVRGGGLPGLRGVFAAGGATTPSVVRIFTPRHDCVRKFHVAGRLAEISRSAAHARSRDSHEAHRSSSRAASVRRCRRAHCAPRARGHRYAARTTRTSRRCAREKNVTKTKLDSWPRDRSPPGFRDRRDREDARGGDVAADVYEHAD